MTIYQDYQTGREEREAMSEVAIVIPARYGSGRFEGKPLARICGQTMIHHVFDRVCQVASESSIFIATDDPRIAGEAGSFGARCIMTGSHHSSGTSRIVEAMDSIDRELLINVQGDEPLIHPQTITAVAVKLCQIEGPAMVTARVRITDEALVADPNCVKVVVDREGRAMYFSRAAIPHRRTAAVPAVYGKHLGIYGYSAETLRLWAGLERTTLEQLEDLEQLRFLENGVPVYVQDALHDSVGVDVPDDVERVERALRGLQRD